MRGYWIVEVRGPDGEWTERQGFYDDLPSPENGGTVEQVIAAERESAARQGVTYEDSDIRAEWVRKEA